MQELLEFFAKLELFEIIAGTIFVLVVIGLKIYTRIVKPTKLQNSNHALRNDLVKTLQQDLQSKELQIRQLELDLANSITLRNTLQTQNALLQERLNTMQIAYQNIAKELNRKR